MAECIPIVGAISGGLRSGLGTFQAISGIAVTAVGLVGQAFGTNHRKWEKVTKLGCEQIIHGALNVLRGVIAVVIGTPFIGLASPILLVPNLSRREHFSPCFDYSRHPAYSPLRYF